jgi:hypothetical protein
MKRRHIHINYLLTILWLLPLAINAQTPYDSFAPEATCPMICAQAPFKVFCNKFPLVQFPLYANVPNIETKELYYFQLHKNSPITEEEFQKYIRTSRWGEYQRPSDSLLHIYHYMPAGRFMFGTYIVLIINCGYMPQPKEYEDSDIGAYENLLCIYTQDGERTDSIIFSKVTCVTNEDGRFASSWTEDMPMMYDMSALSADGEIIIKRFKDNAHVPYRVDTMYIDSRSGKIK